MSKTLIVLDEAEDLELEDKELSTISFEQYLTDYPRHDEPRTRVINLCDTEHYLSRGYYCSLLAESRTHRVLPSVNTINDLRLKEDGMENSLQALLPKLKDELELPVELVNLRVRLTAPAPHVSLHAADQERGPESGAGLNVYTARESYVVVPGHEQPARVLARASMKAGEPLSGPAVILDDVATTWLAPGWTATPDAVGNLHLA